MRLLHAGAFALAGALLLAPIALHADEPFPEDTACVRATLDDAPDGAVALLGARWILAEEIEDFTLPVLLDLDAELAEARVRQLTMMVSARLLAAEAAMQGVSDVELLRRELRARIAEPTEEELRAAYETLAGRDLPPFDALRSPLRRQLLQMRQAEASARYAEELRTRAGAVLTDEADLLDPPDWPDEHVLASWGEGDAAEAITAGEWRAALAPVRAEFEQRVYEVRIEGLDVVVNSILLADEAARRGLDTRALLEEEVAADLPVVSDAQVLRYHERNRDAFDVDIDTPEGRRVVRTEIERQLRMRAELEFAEQLRDAAELRVLIPPPAAMVWELDDAGQPTLGPERAPVVVQVFHDLECSSCAWLWAHLPEVRARFGDRVRIVARDFPLERHPLARAGALAAEAAHAQGRFFEFVGAVHESGGAPDEETLRAAAETAGLDLERFERDRADDAVRSAVDADIREGLRIGIEATPAVHVNGRRVAMERATSLVDAIAEVLEGPAARREAPRKP